MDMRDFFAAFREWIRGKTLKFFSKSKVKINFTVEMYDSATVVRDERGDIASGKLLGILETHNKIVDDGLDLIRSAISRTTTPLGYIAAGTDSTAAAAGQTALLAEIDRVGIISYDDISTGVVRFRAIFEADQANGSLAEFGIFNDALAGVMGARATVTPFDKDNSITLRVNWTFTFVDV